MSYAVLAFAVLSLAGTVSGWIYAFRARGQANAAAERARIADGKTDVERDHAFQAAASGAVALSQLKGLELDLAQARQDLIRSRSEKAELLEQVAKLGVPVGADLYDSTIDRLYADRDRREARGGQNPGAGGAPNGLPVVAAGPALAPDKG